MTRSYDFVVATVVTLVAIIWHRMAVGFLDPSGTLYEIAADATNLGGASLASWWHSIGVMWLPLIAIGGIWLYVFVREFRRQAITGTGARPP